MLKSKTHHKLLAVACLLFATFSCATTVTKGTTRAGNIADTPFEMMSSTVRLHVTVRYTEFSKDDNQSIETSDSKSWMGSGVVYEKINQKNGTVRSRILSANHVLETPAVGTIEDNSVTLLGIEIPLGKHRVDSVKIELQTADGRMCNVKVLALGSNDEHDTATAEADCDAGPVVQFATAMPIMGEKVFVSGYSAGVTLPVLTEGYVSGWLDGYLLTSAAAISGNSGGPVFHNGEVIGLLVRRGEYSHITFVASLKDCLQRIAETPPL